jgi:hypothetical protein
MEIVGSKLDKSSSLGINFVVDKTSTDNNGGTE